MDNQNQFQTPQDLNQNPQPTPLEPSLTKPKIFGPKILALILVLLVLGAGSALGYYKYKKDYPKRLWDKFLSGTDEKVYKTDYSFSYNFDYEESSFYSKEKRTIPGILSIQGDQYSDLRDLKNPILSGNLDFGFLVDAMSRGTEFSYLVVNKIIYIDLTTIPQFALSEFGLDGYKWVSIDFEKIRQFAAQLSAETGEKIPDFEEAFKITNGLPVSVIKEWSKQGIIKPVSLVGNEELNDVKVYHFKNELNKKALLPTLFDKINKVMKVTSYGKELNDSQKKFISLIVDKIQVKEFETWVGQSDNQLYKIKLVVSAPSPKDFEDYDFMGGLFSPLGAARGKSRNAKRLADVRQMASALELYFNDNYSYPAGENGKPIGLTPNYIGLIPEAPKPADGKCSDYFNNYWYEPGPNQTYSGKNSITTYTLTFCLGADTGGYKAGIAKLTQAGIQDNIECPSKNSNDCQNSNNSSDGSYDDELAKMQFGAEIKFESTFSDFGKVQELKAPEKSLDFVELITLALNSARAKSRDAKRLADIRQLASANELYFNDKNSYPANLNDLVPYYIGLIPTPPTPNDGVCSTEDNQYKYTRISPEKYQLTFCLGASTGGYYSGKHTLTQAGIQ